MNSMRKTERFDARIPSETKALFMRAAELEQKSLTAFIISTVENRSREIITEHEKILVTENDKKVFFAAIMNPEKPNKDLAEAAIRFNNILHGSNEIII